MKYVIFILMMAMIFSACGAANTYRAPTQEFDPTSYMRGTN
jgi:PBP1b-binding outer membrane lipoprotein LpoB